MSAADAVDEKIVRLLAEGKDGATEMKLGRLKRTHCMRPLISSWTREKDAWLKPSSKVTLESYGTSSRQPSNIDSYAI